jgi:hypothetical protein
MVPEMEKVVRVAVKSIPVLSASMIVTLTDSGSNENKFLDGVTVYVPAGNPVSVYTPESFVVTVFPCPLETLTPDRGLLCESRMVPEME